MLGLLPALAQAQDGATITGRVTNEAGQPVASATVAIQALGAGTLTRDDGSYTLTIPAARVQGQEVALIARLVGYKPATVNITLRSGSITQDFVLAANPLQLGEVVVTGAGTATTVEKLGSTRNAVDSSVIARSNESNIVQALAAKAPNISVVQQSGEPGASSSIRIRGAKTITGTGQPLFVVDGMPIDNSTRATGTIVAGTVAPNRASDINPADIENIEILKGAAAAAIYGARAGQGVILITTKSGRPGPTRYSLKSSYSVESPLRKIPLQRRWGMGTGGVASGCSTLDCSIGTTAAASSWGAELAPGTPTYDQFDALFENGSMFDNTLTVSGGNDRTSFFLSGGLMQNSGIIVGPNDHYQRATTRVKATHQVFDNLRVGANASYVNTDGRFVQKGSNTSGLLLGGLRTPPEFNNWPYLDPETGLHRSFRFPKPSPLSTARSRLYDNPLFVIYEQQNTGQSGRVYGNIDVDWAALDWLTVKYTLGADYGSETRLEALPKTSSSLPAGQILRYDFSTRLVDHNLVATASYSLNENVAGTFSVGQNLNDRNFQQVFVTGTELLADRPYKLTNTVDISPPFDNETRQRSEGYFGQATVDMYNQLYLTTSLRYDGNSAFGQNKKYWYPKASAAWNFKQDDGTTGGFLGNVLTFGKLRAAFGQVGQSPNPYQLQSVYNAGFSFADGGWGSTITATQAGRGALFSAATKGQDKIKPERTTETEVGLDVGFLENRVDASLTYYYARSSDVIFALPLPPSTGYTQQLQNAATIRNKGWEASLNFRPITRPELSWDVGVTWGKNDNLLLNLEGAERVDQNAGTFTGAVGTAWKGYPLGVLRGNDYARCGRQLVIRGVNIDEACGEAPAGALYLDDNGFPIQDPTDRVIMNPQPDWTGGLNSTIRYKKLSLSGFLDIRHGGQVWNGTRASLLAFGTHKDTEIRGQERTFGTDFLPGPVAGPGVGKKVVIDEDWFTGLGGGFGAASAPFMEDGGFVRLREVSLGYSLDNRFVRNTLGFSNVDLRVSGRNLALWTKYTGLDPETNLGGAEVFVQGIDYFNNPSTRSFVFTVTLNR
jgi:TonB-linked SusC/RagA family outer membrane protein